MTGNQSNHRVTALLLAAGLSSRFGSTKLTAPLNGRPLIQHALSAAQGAFPGSVAMVVGHEQDIVVRSANGLADKIITNSAFRRGMGSSIAAGIRACRNNADAIVMMLGDQPLITAENLSLLIDKWSGDASQIIASSFEDSQGPPILFPRDCFDELAKLDGDMGARNILANPDFDVRTVACRSAAFDVDTPNDLERLAKAR